MKTIKNSVKIECQFSENNQHRYSYMKRWDTKKKMATIITIYPVSKEPLEEDLTTMLITNQLIKDYGGFYLVNLFSKLGLNKMNLSNTKELNDAVSDEIIVACAEASSVVIIAWGSVTQLKLANSRAQEVQALIEPSGKVMRLTDEEGVKNYHPLSPKVRTSWKLRK